MLLDRLAPLSENPSPLRATDVDEPPVGARDLLVEVAVCGVCHTELDEIEGRLVPPELPIVLGHQVVGRVVACGAEVTTAQIGDRVGVAWIHSACGRCARCRRGDENLCEDFRATGFHVHGGYAERMTVHEDFAHAIPEALDDAAAAPLLCAGAIGYRSLRLAGLEDGDALGLTGFGASAHLVLPLARAVYPNSPIHVFARGETARRFARDRGADWVGGTEDVPPRPLRAIIDTTPAWTPVVAALAALEPGGRVVVNAIRKEGTDQDALDDLDYARHLWMEKELKSVANVTRADVRDFLTIAAREGLRSRVEEFELDDANGALRALKNGGQRGALVLRVR